MKKTLSMVLAIVLLCGLAVTAYAANMDLSVSSDNINAGDTVVVTVTLEETIDVSAGAVMMQGELHYDGEILEFVSVEKGSDYAGLSGFSAAKHGKEDKVLFTHLDLANYEPVAFQAGTIVTVTFRAKEETSADHVSTVLELRNAYVQNQQGQNVGDLTYRSNISVLVCKAHTWDDGVVTREPGCTEAGIMTYTCTFDGCGTTMTEEIAAPGHSYENGVCTVCGVTVVASGWSGYTTWVLTSDGVLTFTGEGAMKNYTYKSEMPWYSYFDQITSVVIGEGVTSIGAYAFYAAPQLQTISIADSVTSIGDYAFKNAPKIDDVVLPDGLTSLGDSAFYACTALTSIEIPDSLYTIKPYTFKNCTALTEVVFNEGNLMKISDGAFYGTALTELVLPDCLDILDVYAFKGCTKLTSITLGSGLTQIREAVFYGTAIPNITIPEGITSVGPYAFKNCVNLVSIDLPSTLTSVGEASFYACTALETMDFPDNVTRIGNYAFRKCAALETVTFGSKLENIGETAFYGCSSIRTLVIPDSVTTIQGYAFKACTSLTSVTLGSSLTTIGDSAFHTCTGLKTIVFPASVSEIGAYCFSGSYNLWQLTFQGDAPTIGTSAFKSMTAYAYYPDDNATWTSDVMQNYGGSITWNAS